MKTIFPDIDEDEILQIFSKIFSGLISIKNEKDIMKSVYINTIDLALNGLNLKLNIDMSTHDILIDCFIGRRLEISAKSKNEVSKKEFDESQYTYSLKGDDNIDRNNIKTMLMKLGANESHNFVNDKDDETKQFLSVSFQRIFCNNMDLAHWLIKVVARQLGFITGEEYRKLRDIISFESSGIRHEEMEAGLLNAFEQSLDIMQTNNVTEDNSENFNDGDRTIFYVKKDDICGIVHSSQNFMFFTAKNNKTGIVKSWHSMIIEADSEYDWFSDIKDDSECDEDGNPIFNALEFLSYFADNSFGFSYRYPCELVGGGFQKNFKYYLENFDYDGVDCVYNSEKGFNPNDIESSNYLCFDLECSQNYLTDAFDVKLKTINFSDIDVNSVEYFINSVACIAATRAYALHYLFMVCGNGFHWNGSTYFDGEAVLKKYPSSSTYTNYSEASFEDPFAFGGFDFKKLPKNASDDWKKAFFELAFYLKEWLVKHPEKDKDGKYSLAVDTYYSENYDDEVVQRINRYRK